MELKTSFGNGSLASNGGENTLSAESYRQRHEISVTVSICIINVVNS